MLIKNGLIYTITQGTHKTDIRVSEGKIQAIGNLSPLPDEQVINAEGKHVLPGFIDAHCHIGMWEEGVGFEGADGNEMTDPLTPHLRAIDAINPRCEAFELALKGGVTTAASGPGSANVVGGTFAVIKLFGHRIEDMIINDRLAMKCAFGENPKRVYADKKVTPMTRMGTAALLRQLLFKTKEYNDKILAAGDDASKMPAFDMKLEAMRPVINKEIPLKAHAHRTDDIFTAIRIAKEFDLKLTLEHVTEGHLIADDLAKEGYFTVVGPSFGSKTKYELNQKSFVTPGILSKAGVKVAIMTDSPVIPLEYLPMCASLAVKAGMDADEALKAITIYAAQVLELEHRLGSLEVGKDADLVIWDRHPFDLHAQAEVTIVDGQLACSNQ